MQNSGNRFSTSNAVYTDAIEKCCKELYFTALFWLWELQLGPNVPFRTGHRTSEAMETGNCRQRQGCSNSFIMLKLRSSNGNLLLRQASKTAFWIWLLF